MLDKNKAFGLMIDMQEKLVPAMSKKGEIVRNCKVFIEGLNALDVPVVETHQYTKGLGETVPKLNGLIERPYIEKIDFSCWQEEKFKKAFLELKAKQIMIFGSETHICVLQTALDMLNEGYGVYIIEDCVASRFDNDKVVGLRRLEQAGAVITTFEAALFELCKVAKGDSFKAVSKIVKTR